MNQKIEGKEIKWIEMWLIIDEVKDRQTVLQ